MWKKRVLALATVLIMTATTVVQAEEEGNNRFPMPDFDVPCKAAMLICQDTGEILYEKNPDQQVPIASITKVMTLMLTFEAIEQGKIALTDTVPVSQHAYSMGGSQIWLEPGEQFTLDEMIKAICVSSANDAAVAVAEFVGGSEPAFAEMMNKKAQELGMSNTVFKNACGLDEAGHLSSARDVATMSRAMLENHPQIKDYTTIWMDTLRNGETQLLNTNKLLKRYQGVYGLKTGTTSGAGVCISAAAERDGLRLIAVVLGAASSGERFDAATALLDYGFANFEMAGCTLPEDAPKSLPVTRGLEETVGLEYPAGEGVLMQKGTSGELSVEIDLPQSLAAPVEKGQTVGYVTLKGKEGILGKWPIVTQEKAEEITFLSSLEILYKSLIRL